MNKYKRIYQAFNDLVEGLIRAQSFYSEMKDTVESLSKNVENFLDNRKSEGAQLLTQIESAKAAGGSAQADRERERMNALMERMSLDPSSGHASPPRPSVSRPSHQQVPLYQSNYNSAAYSQNGAAYGMQPVQSPGLSQDHQRYLHPATSTGSMGSYQSMPPPQQSHPGQQRDPYNPSHYPPVSPPPSQQSFSPTPSQLSAYQSMGYGQQQAQHVPVGWQPPPPPPGPPPHHDYSNIGQGPYPAGPGGYAQKQPYGGQHPSNDPWAQLTAWK